MLQDDDDDDDEDGILATLTAGDDDSSEEESDSEDEALLAQAPKVCNPLPASLLRCFCTCVTLSLVAVSLLLKKFHHSTCLCSHQTARTSCLGWPKLVLQQLSCCHIKMF